MSFRLSALALLISMVVAGLVASAQPATPAPPADPAADPAAAPVADSAAAPSAAPAVLQVYTKPIEPFSFQREDQAVGFSIDLWSRVATELGVKYELHWVKTVNELVDALKNRQADVGIAAISITSEREAVVDFSTPYYESGLGILAGAEGKSATGVIMDSLLSMTFLKIFLVLFGLLIVTAHLIWFFERRRDPASSPGLPPRHLGVGVVGDLDHPLRRLRQQGAARGRRADHRRAVDADLHRRDHLLHGGDHHDHDGQPADLGHHRRQDLPGQKVATVKGTTAEKYLTAHRAKVSAVDTIDQAFEALDRHDVKAVVYDEPVLLYHLKTSGSPHQTVVGRLFERQNYGIGLQENSPYRKDINRNPVCGSARKA